jgi:hypothetical protein
MRKVLGPIDGSNEAVVSWLKSHNATEIIEMPNGDYIKALVPMKTLEEILQTRFHVFEHESRGKDHLNCIYMLNIPR